MADVTTKVCDVCGEGLARAVSVREHGASEWLIDLCPLHHRVIAQFREFGRAPAGRRAYRRYRKSEFVDRRSVDQNLQPSLHASENQG